MNKAFVIELDGSEVLDLLDYLTESDYPKNETVLDIIDRLEYFMEDVEPLDFDDTAELED